MVCGFLWIFMKIETRFIIKPLLYKIQIHIFKLDLGSLLRGEALLVLKFLCSFYVFIGFYVVFISVAFRHLKNKLTTNLKHPLYPSPVSLSLPVYRHKLVWNYANNKLLWLLNPQRSNTFLMFVEYYLSSGRFQI